LRLAFSLPLETRTNEWRSETAAILTGEAFDGLATALVLLEKGRRLETGRRAPEPAQDVQSGEILAVDDAVLVAVLSADDPFSNNNNNNNRNTRQDNLDAPRLGHLGQPKPVAHL